MKQIAHGELIASIPPMHCWSPHAAYAFLQPPLVICLWIHLLGDFCGLLLSHRWDGINSKNQSSPFLSIWCGVRVLAELGILMHAKDTMAH